MIIIIGLIVYEIIYRLKGRNYYNLFIYFFLENKNFFHEMKIRVN